MNDELEHDRAREETGFWGRRGAGSLIMARTTGRMLIQLRSENVEEPNSWGTWGGAIDSELSPEDAALNEFEEETGVSSNTIREIIPLYVFKHPSGFEYHNFLIVVDDEFTPRPNQANEWEIDGFKWFKFGQFPKPLHFGLKALLQHDGKKLEDIVARNSRAERLTEWIGSGIKNYWLSEGGSLIEVNDHIQWVIDTLQFPDGYEVNDDGYPIDPYGSLLEPEDVYEIARDQGYVRVTVDTGNRILFFTYGINQTVTSKQIRELKNFAIENKYTLRDGNTAKEIELLEVVKSKSTTMTMYHGTSASSGKNLVVNGWQPNKWNQGGNLGQMKYLYLTTDSEDARWFANEKGEDTIVKVKHIPLNYLIVDSEDGTGKSVANELESSRRLGLPAKLALTKPLPREHFSIL
jgi:8-oxo-dGTP pyrophosphatase MutT (NUDIX family)